MCFNFKNKDISPNTIVHPLDPYIQLKCEFDELKSQIQQFKQSQKQDKIKSFKDFKKELITLSLNCTCSHVLNTTNFVKTAFSALFMLGLFLFCIFYIRTNVKSYQSNDVVTQIKGINENEIDFPAVTLCLFDYTRDTDISRDLSEVFQGCYFNHFNNPCTLNEFEHFYKKNVASDLDYNCYKFNGGRNISNHELEIRTTQLVGCYSGLILNLNLSKTDTINYFVGDNQVQPVVSELDSIIESNKEAGKYVAIGIKKTVDIKIPVPYSNCTDKITPDISYLVKRITDLNIAYRQKNCYQLCFEIYLEKYASARNTTQYLAYFELNYFDYKGNCSALCPLECSSATFEISQVEYSNVNIKDNYVWVNFYYNELKYTEISQTVKTTWADLVSNTGGVLGLFLEFTFLSVYRILIFVFDMFFL